MVTYSMKFIQILNINETSFWYLDDFYIKVSNNKLLVWILLTQFS